MRFDADQFRKVLPDEIMSNAWCGIEELRDRVDEQADDRDLLDEVERDIKKVYMSDGKILVIDITGGIHLFRLKLERIDCNAQS